MHLIIIHHFEYYITYQNLYPKYLESKYTNIKLLQTNSIKMYDNLRKIFTIINSNNKWIIYSPNEYIPIKTNVKNY